MRRNAFIRYSMIVTVALAMTACSDNTTAVDPMEPEIFAPSNGEIMMSAASKEASSSTTRTSLSDVVSAKTTDVIKKNGNGIGVYAYYTGDAAFTKVGDAKAVIFNNEQVTFNAEQQPWKHENKRYWPTSPQKLSFFAYAPYLDGTETYSANDTGRKTDTDSLVHLATGTDGIPAVRCFQSYKYDNMPDVLWGTRQTGGVAYTDETQPKDNYVHWSMRHGLAKVELSLVSGINLDNEESQFDGLGTKDFTYESNTYRYSYSREESKFVIEGVEIMDYYDKGTLELLNHVPAFPTWSDCSPEGKDDGENYNFDKPFISYSIPLTSLNKDLVMQWTKKGNELSDDDYKGSFIAFPEDFENEVATANTNRSNETLTSYIINDTQWSAFKISSTSSDYTHGVIESDQAVNLFGADGDKYVMVIPFDPAVAGRMIKVRVTYRVIHKYYAKCEIQKTGSRGWRQYTYWDEDKDNSFYFYEVMDQQTAKGIVNNKIDGTHHYKMRMNISSDYLPLEVDVQDWDVQDIEYSDENNGVTIAGGGQIEWAEDGFVRIDDKTGYIYINFKTAKCTFEISKPENASWRASLISVGGTANAFEFIDENGNVIDSPSGFTGEKATLIIRAKNQESVTKENRAILRIFIIDSMGNGSIVNNLTGNENFTEWTIVQQVN